MEISKELIKQAKESNNENLIYFAYIIDNMYNLYEKKNKNYGNSFGDTWEKLGPISGITRLYDKMNRATSLVRGTQNDFESLEDTFIDMANYAVMCEVELLKEKIKNNEAEAKAFNNYIKATVADVNNDSKKRPGKTVLNEEVK